VTPRRSAALALATLLVSVAGVPVSALGSDAPVAAAGLPSVSPAGQEVLSDERLLSRWAYPADTAPVYERPSAKAHTVDRLRLLTEDKFPEVYLALSRWVDPKGDEWIRIRLPARPNGKTGWARAESLGDLQVVRTMLQINRKTLRATLYKSGRKIWSAPVGIGKAATPTPAGHFWIREKFRVKDAPVYGTQAIGTSAYAPTLSDWPGGGVVGLHGTNEPYLIPGRPSHGCVRVKNADIAKLYRLAPVGTPIRIL
jgi:lipoprotein-anchoring transpeptidase ErfK/SrfK